ncbi:hypothetical protein Y1Q_0004041 [Alligator mississippiensis]|uniref:Uncharacterized protein n=1 Tax=Alligator mississippiensis TaxID=8496 RepID=A0A151PHY2_ALLMI|nr:hypothetical protein Y1Q_0004041 [Alligator mississippiensis]
MASSNQQWSRRFEATLPLCPATLARAEVEASVISTADFLSEPLTSPRLKQPKEFLSANTPIGFIFYGQAFDHSQGMSPTMCGAYYISFHCCCLHLSAFSKQPKEGVFNS